MNEDVRGEVLACLLTTPSQKLARFFDAVVANDGFVFTPSCFFFERCDYCGNPLSWWWRKSHRRTKIWGYWVDRFPMRMCEECWS